MSQRAATDKRAATGATGIVIQCAEKCFSPSCLTEGVEEFEDRYAPGGRFRLCAEHAGKLRVMTTTGPALDMDVYLQLFFPLPSEDAS